MKLLLSFFIFAFVAYGACVDERTVSGANLEELAKNFDVYVETERAKFEKIDPARAVSPRIYRVQLLPKTFGSTLKSPDPFGDPFARYNRRYLRYYTYPRMKKYLASKEARLDSKGYKIEKIGKSLADRDLFYVGPKNLDPSKKTIVMFGRHHGDEGTANWIIEGFLDRYLADAAFQEEFQLVLYPMINPDGAMEQTRYNLNGRDLNRSWNSRSGLDEIKAVHGHLKAKLKRLKDVVIALDMHGSWDEDFIYRVKRGFKGDSFYEMQQDFIDELGAYDTWQAGNFILSNGHPGMARIVLINHYKLHALTHETIRNIPLRNSRKRDLNSLKEQGEAIVSSIRNLH